LINMNRHLVAVVAMMLALAAAVSAAQRPGVAGQGVTTVDPFTASISGRITAADSGVPIRRAEVRAISERGVTRLATTDADGRYDIRDLPEGTYRLHASKSGFVPLNYGQRRPFEASIPLTLAQRQQVSANVMLPRAGAIVGRVFDEAGEPMAQVRVQAMRSRTIEGQRRLQVVGAPDSTDDTGAYRIYALQPGDYYVSAMPERLAPPMGRRPVASRRVAPPPATVFFPGTARFAEAQRVTVDVGGEARADIPIGAVKAARVSGTVFSSTGGPASGAMISLISDDLAMAPGGMEMLAMMSLAADADPDGTFEVSGVPPGTYTVRAQYRPPVDMIFDPRMQTAVPANPAAMAGEAGITTVVVNDDVAGLAIVTAQPGSLEVSVAADGSAGRVPPRVEVRLRAADRTSLESMMMNTRADGTFKLAGVVGPSYLAVQGLPAEWAVKSITVDGTDVTDRPIELRPGAEGRARVVLTDRVTQISGTVSVASAAADRAARASVVVFPDDSRKWVYQSRFMRTVRADEQGAFLLQGLPPDEDYRAVAVDYLEEGEGSDPEFLERIRSRATPFSLRDAERKALDLRIVER
jgi:hypothetical protein